MTYTQLVAEVLSRLNLSSPAAETRVGLAINRAYKLVTSAIGLNLSRRTQVQADVTLGVQTLTFLAVEKVLNVIDKTSGRNRIIQEVTVDEIEAASTGVTTPHSYAIYGIDSHTVTILLDIIPQSALTLYADGYERAGELSGSLEPAFPESFHEVLVEKVLSDEYRKMEKPQLASMAANEYERLLSDLRMFIAKSAYIDIYQGKTAPGNSFGTASGGGSGSGGSASGASSYVQTGLITFDRDPLAPFAVSASSAVVPNLDADKLDGLEASAFALSADLSSLNASNLTSGTVPDARFPATLPAASGVNLTALNATQLTSGTLPLARLSNITNTEIAAAAAIAWTKISKTGSSLADLTTKSAADLSSGTLADARFPSVLPVISLINGYNGANNACDGRITLTTAVPVTSADVTAATTVRYTPYIGNRIDLYDTANWIRRTFSELSLSLGSDAADTNYDLFAYDNAGTVALERLAWTNATTRATALAYQDGVLVKSGTTTRRYLGTYRTTGTVGQTEDSDAKRFVWNYYNRQARRMRVAEGTDTWNYNTATWRQARATATNQLAFVLGYTEDIIQATLNVASIHSAGNTQANIAIGVDSTTTPSANGSSGAINTRTNVANMIATYSSQALLGYHTLVWLEQAQNSGTQTWYGDNGGTDYQSAIVGVIRG